MPRVNCVMETPVVRTTRVKQMEGMFDVAPSDRSKVQLSVDLPIEDRKWNIGLIVGPSGCGKTTIAKKLYEKDLVTGFDWPHDRSILDGFPNEMGIKEITSLLSSVGFSSPPSWMRPFHVLSNGEQFRVTIARAMAEQPELAVIDEFTSVVDRTVAKIGSSAVSKAIRRSDRKLIALACHYDIVDWLDPDWTFDPSTGEFHWRLERQRPAIELEIIRVHSKAWKLFKTQHYLESGLNKCAHCFAAIVDGQMAAFSSVLSSPGRVSYWREHRTVCLPDFQGVGIGNALSEYVAGLFSATGKDYKSSTSSPAMIRHRLKSKNWRMSRKPSFVSGRNVGKSSMDKTSSKNRYTAGFTFTGSQRPEDAKGFGLRVPN